MHCYSADSNYIQLSAKPENSVMHTYILHLPSVVSKGASSPNQTEEGAIHPEINWSFKHVKQKEILMWSSLILFGLVFYSNPINFLVHKKKERKKNYQQRQKHWAKLMKKQNIQTIKRPIKNTLTFYELITYFIEISRTRTHPTPKAKILFCCHTKH